MQYQKPVIIQEQRLKMNPQLYQSIQLMALPLQELKFTIQQELERNPALEVVDDKADVSLDDAEDGQPEDYDYFENSSDPGYSRRLDQAASDSKQKFIEGALARPESLHEHLLWQLRVQPIPKVWFETGELLINNLDENGFHREDPAIVVGEKRAQLLPDLFRIIQSFEPIGACTRDYRESLIVQASLNPEAPSRTVEVLRDWLDLLERGKYAEIARKLKVPEDQVRRILEFVKTLEPFPGRQYSTDHPTYVIPDLMVKLKDGEFVIILNDEEIPVLGVSDFFTEILRKNREKKPEKELKTFVNNSVKDARWFIRSISQRNDTLLKIAKAIIEFQRDFFLRGPKYLVPLTLKDIANEVSVHETTVSRISNQKYVQTEFGIFELKYFFSNSISGAGSSGSRFSKEGVKQIIKEIIEQDGSARSLSDQKIAEVLSKKGIKLARRTVAKYRKELDIQSSYGR